MEEELFDGQGIPDPTSLIIDDLTRRVAVAHLEAAQWRARAITAEATLEALKGEEEDAVAAED